MQFPQLARLLEILAHLRGPHGCEWDRSQDLSSAARHLADEVFEYVDAAQSGDDEAAASELSDLLYMLAYNWLLLSERRPLDFDELASRGADKLVRRKPHVFDDDPRWKGLGHEEIWRKVKAAERGENPDDGAVPSVLKDLHASTSPLRQALVFGEDAARVGFDWSGPEPVFAKIQEEIDELQEARENLDPDAIEDELGDLLFAVVQLGRKLSVDPDRALRRTNAKFARRFRAIEARYGHDPAALRALDLEELWHAWNEVKRIEKSNPSED